ncbi:MAG TPA: thiamine phosphate synthase [Candidatus Baltobacteraceae bacterium]|nr:thiamine phosphate synthase [Candidatus Baltobacteraceae bacterium]
MAVRAHAQAEETVMRAQRAALLRGVYAIVNEAAHPEPVELTRAILEGGARIVQYRAKSGIVPAHARALRDLTRAYGALFIVNDDWHAVDGYDADGVHLGPEDARAEDLAEIRAALADRVIGVSCGTPHEARAAAQADYIGVGSVYATASKADAGDPIGIAGLRAVAAQTSLPVAAIGGITLASLPQIRASGVAMAAVISAISAAADPRAATAALVRLWNGA